MNPAEPQDCFICLQEVNPKGVIQGAPECLTCENGHYVHRECLMENVRINGSNKCWCGSDINKNCYSNMFGYAIKPKEAGGKKLRKSRKIRKIRKLRKTKRRYKK